MGEALLVGKMMENRGEPSWTGKPTWRDPRSLLRGHLALARGILRILTRMRGILTTLSPVRGILINLIQVRGILTNLIQMRGKIGRDRERSLFRVLAVPLPSLVSCL